VERKIDEDLDFIEQKETMSLFSKRVETLHKLHKEQRKQFGRQYEKIIRDNFGIQALTSDARSHVSANTNIDHAIRS